VNPPALCPSCQQEVVFVQTGDAAVCPNCGARFAITLEIPHPSRLRPGVGLLSVAWMFAPAFVAMLAMLILPMKKNPQFGQFFTEYPSLFTTLAGLSCFSCFAACAWLAGRFTDKLWVRLTIGLSLGATILLCNVVVVFFGSCAFIGGLRS
jgi:hypothetical protein